MFNKTNQMGQGSNGPSIEKTTQGLCGLIAARGAFLAMPTIYGASFEWAAALFTDAFNNTGLGQLGGYGFVALATLTLWQVCRLTLQIALMLLASSAIMRFAF